MRHFVLVIVILIGIVSPLAAAPADLSAPDAMRGYGYLLASTGFATSVERAAFVVKGDDGEIRFIRWMSAEHNKARYRGTVPAGCIAIAHTHPRGFRNPSLHDVDEAKHLGLPIIVVTTDGVTVALPDGTVETLNERR